jgi:hypothetical protein
LVIKWNSSSSSLGWYSSKGFIQSLIGHQLSTQYAYAFGRFDGQRHSIAGHSPHFDDDVIADVDFFKRLP